MLNHKIASNLLKHIFISSGYIRTGSAGNYNYGNLPFLEGMNGRRYLALFNEMPVATGEGGKYVIKAGKEPWGIKTDPLSPDGLVEGHPPVQANEKPTSGYRRTIISAPDHVDAKSYPYSPVIDNNVSINYSSGQGNTGITGNYIFDTPEISDGSEINSGYSTTLKFNDGVTYLYNGDMIFFPESIQDWNKIVGFGVFKDNGLTTGGNLMNHDDNYYTDNLLFWGTLTPQEDEDEIGVVVEKNEIAIFRNNDFQISINNEESNKADPNA